MAGFRDLIRELRRRRVFRAAGIYVVAAWVGVQVAALIFPAINVPESAIRYVWIAVVLLFPLALVFSWFFDVSTDGITRTPPVDADERVDLSLRRADALILGALALVGISIAWQTTSTIRDVPSTITGEGRQPISIAILPLENLTGDPEQQYFVAGMYDGLFGGLSRIAGLKMISIPPPLLNSGTAETIKPLVSQFGVENFVEGTVERDEDMVRISVQLTDAAQDRETWEASFEESIVNIVTLHGEMANTIAAQVLGSESDLPGVEQRPINPAAFEAYLQGEFHVDRYNPDDIQRGYQYYQQALRIDPDYALAYTGLVKHCGVQFTIGMISGQDALERCLPPALQAIRLESDLPEAQLQYANYMLWNLRDLAEAGSAYERAIELNPNLAEARFNYSNYLAFTGDLDASRAEILLARELDPLNPIVHMHYAFHLRMRFDFVGMLEVVEQVMASAPGFDLGNQSLWEGYRALGQYDKAVDGLVALLRVLSPRTDIAESLAELYDGSNYEAAMLETADTIVANLDDHPFNRPTAIGHMYMHAGEIERSIDWYEKAAEWHTIDALFVWAVNSEEVRSNPRFIDLLRKLNLNHWADEFSARSAAN